MNSQYETDVIKAALKWHSTQEGVFAALCDMMRNYRSTAKGASSVNIENFKRACHDAYQECEKNSATLPIMDYVAFTTEFDRVYKYPEGDLLYSATDSPKDYK